ncbi:MULTISPECIES: hypothetical protein [Streptomyces]|uniref:Uncharacterized protein n=1 Tax=Streptomyces tsukubensis (strain DSM 42081 / NBRC 108919 / NRRL 18488 / 9993) TaxID=1114943 RepID=I2N054_STRT9|nr:MULTISPECIES: hypothetical protein [Streptomyces]AZK94622.1 hypothetical protein B7R87_12665 [Streptomyces tsukubensis]EIF90401.1 hypothetical protein [Streptomyces tsukubensis NRRL18488]MYS65561.1 hypothetical protein [Streptomyces sp. SID5473]QKM69294.1 hypothetical protein STSU_021105 [Streptomyces tsukubensis NRRL18488]TAI42774.1 hypothetical protein EWI31_20430 [Streptomyces tsukubensis]
MTAGFRDWVLKQVPSHGVSVRVQCAAEKCGAEPPAPANARDVDHDYAEIWTAYHFERTGHRDYCRGVDDTVRWYPPTSDEFLSLPNASQ